MANTYSLDLNGSTQYASIADASQTGLDLSGDLTLECWVKAETLTGDSQIITKYDYGTNKRSYKLTITSTGVVDFLVSDDGTTAAGHYVEIYTNASQVSVGTWVHIAVSFDISADTGIIYINGNSVAVTVDGTVAAGIYNSDVAFAIGTYFNSGTAAEFFDGIIDEVRVWDDIRTQQEIEDNMFKELVGNEANLVSCWTLNNNYLDQTANNNDLTATASPVFTTDISFSDSDNQIEHCVDDNTVTLWHLNGTAGSAGKKNDESVNNLDLTENGSPTSTTGWDGSADGAYSLDGSSQSLSIADNALLDFGTADFSISCWFKTTRNTTQTNGGMSLFQKIKATSNFEGYWMYMRMDSGTPSQMGTIGFLVRTTTGGWVGSYTTTQYNDGNWHHATGVRSGSNVYTYVDGVLQTTTSGANINVDNTGNFYIGTNGSNPGVNDNWDGQVDEVEISNRAKTTNEIIKYYGGIVSGKFAPGANADTVTQREGLSVVTEAELFFGGDGTYIMNFGGRFINVNIPNGSVINRSDITFRAISTQAGSPTVDIFGEDSDDATTFALTEVDFNGRTRTTANVSWSPSAWTAGVDYTSPALLSIVQEIIDRAGWVSGNDLVLFVEGQSASSAYRRFSGYVAGSNDPFLWVEYSNSSVSSVSFIPKITII